MVERNVKSGMKPVYAAHVRKRNPDFTRGIATPSVGIITICRAAIEQSLGTNGASALKGLT